MDGKSIYQFKNVVVAPFLMLYFKEPAMSDAIEVDSDINIFSFFKNHINMYDGKVMSSSKLREFILNPDEHQTRVKLLLMVDEDGVCYPGHVPLLEDLYGYSDVFVTLLTNGIEALEKEQSKNIIPPNLCTVVDPKPKLDYHAPVFAIGNLPIRMSFASYSDAFQVNEFFCSLQVASIYVFHSTLQEERKDGVIVKRMRRYHDIRINPEYFHKYCVKPMPLKQGTRIVTWNVRGVSRPSFLENFEKLVTTYNPQVLLLVESRISEDNMAWMMTRLAGDWGHTMFGDFSVKGGPVVFIYDKLRVKIMDFSNNDDPWIASVRVQGAPRTTTEKELFS